MIGGYIQWKRILLGPQNLGGGPRSTLTLAVGLCLFDGGGVKVGTCSGRTTLLKLENLAGGPRSTFTLVGGGLGLCDGGGVKVVHGW